jgi:glycosyltransferase involved in cell wall biosynthesis
MRVWLITIGEPLPTDEGDNRLLRAGILANLLASKGHDVLWWTSTFDHVRKIQRSDSNRTIKVGDHLNIKMLHAVGYKKNISIRRIFNHIGLARIFSRQAPSEQTPDVILCSLPTLELCLEATRYGRKHGVPVVLDVRDLWPDLFVEFAPAWSRRFARRLLEPLFGMARKACTGAAAIVGVTPEFVAWGLGNAGRAATVWDRDFPMGYHRIELPREECEEALSRWRARGIMENAFVGCFFGTIGRQFDFETVIGAAKMLRGNGRRYQFVLCGSGDTLGDYRRKAGDCPDILFPGWVNRADIWALMSLSSVGLAPYRNKPNFTMNLPNKPVEYLSAGLPLVSSLSGVLAKLISECHCGITYEEGKPDSLAEALVRLYDGRDELRVMAKNAKALYERSFIADRVYGEMMGYLQNISEKWNLSMAAESVRN